MYKIQVLRVHKESFGRLNLKIKNYDSLQLTEPFTQRYSVHIQANLNLQQHRSEKLKTEHSAKTKATNGDYTYLQTINPDTWSKFVIIC